MRWDSEVGEHTVVKASLDIVRAYEDPGCHRGEYRVLVDRLRPRGLSKGAVDHEERAKDAAPITELRRWYGHDPARFAEFSERYRQELTKPPASDSISHLHQLAAHRTLVLLTATRDVEHSGAAVLRSVIDHEAR